MWAERYSIVVMSLRRAHLPSSWGDYHGTLWDWALLSGSIGLFLLGMLLVARYVPIVSMSEMRELWRRANQRRHNESGTP
jgi:molybdopterin-containing oxidoreductase family membrane subunit